jgi:hypothetical protein
MFEKLKEPPETTGSFSQMSYKEVVREALAAEETFLSQIRTITQV